MKWEDFYKKFGHCPIITPPMLYASEENKAILQVQLSRWVKDKKLIKLSREKYVFREPYQKKDLSLPYIANQLVYPSYVSLEYALSYHGLIPEAVYSVTSITTQRPVTHSTEIAVFSFRHVKQSMFWGFEPRRINLVEFLIATPEKALLDTFYFWRAHVTKERMDEMRFQNLDQLNVNKLMTYTERTKSKKLSKIINRYFIPLLHEEAA